MRKFQKLLLNFSPRTMSILGFGGYLRFVACSLTHALRIVRERDLKCVDQAMGTRPIHCRMLGRSFVIDAPFADAKISDGTYTFGLIREIYIRNCYLRAGLDQRLPQCKVVVDLGANRGIFSALAARFAQRVISVEVLPEFIEVIRRNMEAQKFAGSEIEPSFIGAGGEYEKRARNTISMEDLFAKYNIDRVDLMKLDIEGSEFALFQAPQWLTKVSALCMEVHPAHGRVQDILQTLKDHGFTVEYADSMFHAVSDPQNAEFIWAKKAA